MDSSAREYAKVRRPSTLAVRERAVKLVTKESQRDSVLMRVKEYGAARVYAGLLAYIVRKGWKVGAAAHAFKEIYGAWPDRYRNVEPELLPNFLIEEWYALRPKKPRKKPAPLVVAHEIKTVRVVDEDGFVPGTLMTPEDFDVSWR